MSAMSMRMQNRSHEPDVRPEELAQADVVRFMLDPATLGGEPVRHIITHISHIFLVGPYAWKLKRAVRLPFVDFTSPEVRRAACENEVRLNRRTAPELYLGVVPVTEDVTGRHAIGSPVVGGSDVAVDWLVQMKRFKDGALLSEMADAGTLSGDIIDALGDEIVAFHEACDVAASRGGHAAISDVHDGLTETLAKARIPGIGPGELGAWNARIKGLLVELAPLLDARGRAGRVRHCHGDMHLENIVLLDGRPVPFDAIEFSDRIATTDVLYELAFPVMDLICRDEGEGAGQRDGTGVGKGALANRLMNRYLAATRDYAGLAAWPLFLSIRAAIRAAVIALKGDDRHKPNAQAYFKLAQDVLKPAPARLTAIGGLSGSGKSTLANVAAASRTGAIGGAVVLSSDVTRKRMMGARPEDNLPDSAYHGEVSRRVYGRLLKDAKAALKAGRRVIVDATFLHADERNAIEAVTANLGVPFQGYWMDVPADDLRARVKARPSTGPSDAGLEVLERQLATDPGLIRWRRQSLQWAANDLAFEEGANNSATENDGAFSGKLAG